MNIDVIQEEISEFNDNLFNNFHTIISDQLDFIEENDLTEPKKNYVFAYRYLMNTIEYFYNLDEKFSDATFIKLHKDTKIIYKQLKSMDMFLENKDEFVNQFLKTAKILQDINETYENGDEKKEHYKQIRILYEIYYSQNYDDTMDHIFSSLKHILNSKLYYLDRMLWENVMNSEYIVHFLFNLKINIENGMSSKKYLSYKHKVDIPYTDEYAYLTDCLRIFA